MFLMRLSWFILFKLASNLLLLNAFPPLSLHIHVKEIN